MSAEDYIDIAYIAFFDETKDLCELEENKGKADYVSKGGIVGDLDMTTDTLTAEGEILDRDPVDLGDETVFNANSNVKVFLSPKMLYNKSLGTAVGIGNVSLSSDGASLVARFGESLAVADVNAALLPRLVDFGVIAVVPGRSLEEAYLNQAR
jgi:hypothetical protein